MDYYDKKKSHKIIESSFYIFLFAFIFIESFPMLGNIRNNSIYLWISTIVFFVISILLIVIYKELIASIMLLISNVIHFLRIIDPTRRLFTLFVFLYFISSIIVFNKSTSRNRVATDGNVLYVAQGSIYLFIVFFAGLNISLWQEAIFNLPILFTSLGISILLCIFLLWLIYRKNKNEVNKINLFSKILTSITIFLLAVLLSYQSIKVTNYIFDFKEQTTITALVVDNDINKSKNKRYGYRLDVKYEGKIYEITTDYLTAEKYDIGDYIVIKISKGLFNIPYYHIDLQ